MSLTFFAAPDRESQLKVIHIAQHTSTRASPPRHIITRHSSIAPPVASSHEHEKQTLAGWGGGETRTDYSEARCVWMLGEQNIRSEPNTHDMSCARANAGAGEGVTARRAHTVLLLCVNLGDMGSSRTQRSKMVAVHGVFDKSQWHKCHGLAQILKNYKETFLDTAT